MNDEFKNRLPAKKFEVNFFHQVGFLQLLYRNLDLKYLINVKLNNTGTTQLNFFNPLLLEVKEF